MVNFYFKSLASGKKKIISYCRNSVWIRNTRSGLELSGVTCQLWYWAALHVLLHWVPHLENTVGNIPKSSEMGAPFPLAFLIIFIAYSMQVIVAVFPAAFVFFLLCLSIHSLYPMLTELIKCWKIYVSETNQIDQKFV